MLELFSVTFWDLGELGMFGLDSCLFRVGLRIFGVTLGVIWVGFWLICVGLTLGCTAVSGDFDTLRI